MLGECSADGWPRGRKLHSHKPSRGKGGVRIGMRGCSEHLPALAWPCSLLVLGFMSSLLVHWDWDNGPRASTWNRVLSVAL